jgi:hypothetical protein
MNKPVAAATTAAVASQLFGITRVIAQVNPGPGRWLVAGLVCAGGPGPCVPDLVLGGAVAEHGQWRVRLLVRYATSWEGAPGDPCGYQVASRVVPDEAVLIVGCFNGGSDAESFVVVVGFPPSEDLPEILLPIDCGQTWWKVRGNSLVIRSASLRGGASYPGKPHPDVAFTWGGALLPASPVFNNRGADFPPFCHTLAPANT